ncbi:MAG: pyridoxamine 5'-phosphate oxidase family protein, partial [Rhizobiales bacterium]|nr:pyridoxamine 5'-phosphate oxidase family protein [Hyphomicrobiales bacterium]
MTNPQARSFTGYEARKLLRRARRAALGTLDRDTGIPYVSAVNVATDWQGLPVLLISRLARHTQNLLADPRASLMASELATDGDALTGPRVTCLGKASVVADEAMADRYVRLHPYAADYAKFPDFGFWRIVPDSVHAVAGFGRIETMDCDEVILDAEKVREWPSLELSARDHMNDDHRKAVRDYAVNLLSADDGDWSIAALDPDGADLEKDGALRRLEFEKPCFEAVA